MKSKIIFLVVSVIIILGAGVFFLTHNNATSNTSPTPSQAEVDRSSDNASTPLASPSVGMEDSHKSGSVTEVTVTGSSFKFVPATITVKKGDTVRVTFKNVSGTHDFVIDEFHVRTNVITTGKEETIEFVADKVGNFEYYCSVGNHRQLGMRGTLIVQ